MIIQRFKKVLINTLIETGNHNFSYEKFLKFKELNYKTKELFAKKLENVAKVRGERLIQYLPFIFEEELITDFCDRYIDSEHFKKTEDVYKLLIEETGLYSLNRNLRALELLNKSFEVRDFERVEVDSKGKEKIVKYKKLVYINPQEEKKDELNSTSKENDSNEPSEEELAAMYGNVMVMNEPDIDIEPDVPEPDEENEVVDIDVSEFMEEETDYTEGFVQEEEEEPNFDELDY
jgi:hypothetical protein